MNKVLCALAMIIFSCGLTNAVLAAPLDDALAAEKRDDCGTAVPIYRKLAAAGVVEAYRRLGFFNEIGYCMKRDWVQAASWYFKAYDAGDESEAGSLSAIGRNWWSMFPNVPLDHEVYTLIERAAKKGSPVAQFSLGVINYRVDDALTGDQKGNLDEALTWYRRAADQGDVDAQVTMGIAYAQGLGVPQDFVEAHKWFNLAAPRSKYADIRADIMKRRDDVALKMTKDQIAAAQVLAREWKPVK